MRTGRVPLAALLLVLASPVLQVSSTNDIYWEGEEYASNEFLEVKHEEPTALERLKRFKRQWNPFSFSFLPNEEETETVTDAVPDDNGSYGKDDADLDVGSGVPDKSDSEPREKTLRVTFLVMEPYITAYSNRDSPEFLNISRSLANAVDRLFESLPGTQRSSLVRIQSLVNDDFLCKVTLDIVTTRNEDTDTIKDILRNHIKNNGRLGETSVRDGDFSAQLIDPDKPKLCKDEWSSEYYLMHQEFHKLRTEVTQLKVSLSSSKERVDSLEARVNALELKLEQSAPSIKNPGENQIAELEFQMNKRNQKLVKDVKVTGIPEDKVITIKLVITADKKDVAHAERGGSTRTPVESSDGSISLSISADLAAQRSRSISVSYPRPTTHYYGFDPQYATRAARGRGLQN